MPAPFCSWPRLGLQENIKVDTSVLEERPVAAARHILGSLSEAPDPRLAELRNRLKDLAGDQRDVVVSTRELAMAPVDGTIMVGGDERYELREHAFGQLAAKLSVPAPYLRKCDPELRSRNVNRWLQEADRNVLLRFEGSEVRAVLSGSYRTINQLDILGWLEQRLGANTPVRFELTEGYLDLQVVGEAFDHAIELSAQAVTAFAGTRGIQVKEPEKALERIVRRYELAEYEGAVIRRAYQCETGQTLFAVINALTRAGNDNALALESRHKLQTLGGRLTDLSATGRWING